MVTINSVVLQYFLTIFLPFIIIFVLFWALLTKTGVLGTGKSTKRINILLATTISFFVVVINPLNISWAVFFGNLMSGGAIALIGVLFFVMFALFFSVARGETFMGAGKRGLLSLGVGALLAYIALSESGLIEGIKIPQVSNYISQDVIVALAIIAILYGIWSFLSKAD